MFGPVYRSKRAKLKPIAYWDNERIFYSLSGNIENVENPSLQNSTILNENVSCVSTGFPETVNNIVSSDENTRKLSKKIPKERKFKSQRRNGPAKHSVKENKDKNLSPETVNNIVSSGENTHNTSKKILKERNFRSPRRNVPEKHSVKENKGKNLSSPKINLPSSPTNLISSQESGIHSDDDGTLINLRKKNKQSPPPVRKTSKTTESCLQDKIWENAPISDDFYQQIISENPKLQATWTKSGDVWNCKDMNLLSPAEHANDWTITNSGTQVFNLHSMIMIKSSVGEVFFTQRVSGSAENGLYMGFLFISSTLHYGFVHIPTEICLMSGNGNCEIFDCNSNSLGTFSIQKSQKINPGCELVFRNTGSSLLKLFFKYWTPQS